MSHRFRITWRDRIGWFLNRWYHLLWLCPRKLHVNKLDARGCIYCGKPYAPDA